MLGAFADGKHVRRAATGQIVADDDAACDRQAGPDGKLDVRTDAGGDHHHVALERRAIEEGETGHVAIAQNRRRRLFEVDVKSHLLELPLEHASGRRVELRFHQMRHQVDDVDVEMAVQQPPRRLEAEQAAADDGARLACCAWARMRSQSSSVRKTKTPFLKPTAGCRSPLGSVRKPRSVSGERPSIGGTSGRLPVAMTSASYGSTRPFAPRTCLDGTIYGVDADACVKRDGVRLRTTTAD